jgi:hypothetical protein
MKPGVRLPLLRSLAPITGNLLHKRDNLLLHRVQSSTFVLCVPVYVLVGCVQRRRTIARVAAAGGE